MSKLKSMLHELSYPKNEKRETINANKQNIQKEAKLVINLHCILLEKQKKKVRQRDTKRAKRNANKQ